MLGKGDQVVVLVLMLVFGISCITIILIAFLLVAAFAVGCVGMDLQVTALSIEARQVLTRHRPETLGLASRITGITPAAISLLMVHLKKGGFKGFATPAPGAATQNGEAA